MTRITRQRLLVCLGALLLALFVGVGTLQAEVPRTLTHQGRLLEAGVPVDGERTIRFTLYEQDNATPVHDEDILVQFDQGYYTVRLGEQMGLELPEETFGDRPMELSIIIDPDGANIELHPRQKITAVPYAFVSESVLGGTVVASEISTDNGLGTVTPVVSGDGVWIGKKITSERISESSITHAHLSEESVRVENLENGAVTGAKIQSGAISSGHIQSGAVGSSQIADSAVSSADIQDNTVSSSDIANGTITREDVQPMGGLYSRKGDLYETTTSFSIIAGTSSSGQAACNDANDLPLSGQCFTASDAQLRSTRAIGWTDEAAPAVQECVFFNSTGASIMTEARIICISVP